MRLPLPQDRAIQVAAKCTYTTIVWTFPRTIFPRDPISAAVAAACVTPLALQIRQIIIDNISDSSRRDETPTTTFWGFVKASITNMLLVGVTTYIDKWMVLFFTGMVALGGLIKWSEWGRA